jgi:hypothetical protein
MRLPRSAFSSVVIDAATLVGDLQPDVAMSISTLGDCFSGLVSS